MSIASADLYTGLGGSVTLIVIDDEGNKTYLDQGVAERGGGDVGTAYRAWNGETTSSAYQAGPALADAIGGEGAPNDSIGSNGTYMIDEADQLIWGPKSGGTWAGTSRSFKGDTGMTGSTGATGAQGTAGAKGDKGDTGSVGAQGVIGLTGAAGATGAMGAAGSAGAAGATGATGSAGAAGTTFTIGGGAGGRPGSPATNAVYLNTATANFEVYDGATWNVSFSAATAAQGALAASAVQPSGIAAAISANLAAVKTALGLI